MKKTALFGAVSAIFFSGQVQSGSELEILIKMLKENGTVSDAQYKRLKDEINAGSAQAALEKKQMQAQLDKVIAEKQQMLEQLDKASAEIKAMQKGQKIESNIAVKVDKGGIQAKTLDGEFTAKIGGRVQADAAWYDEDGTEMGNGTEIRRARLYIQGQMFNDWGYKLQYDFTGTGKSGIKDAFLSYNGFEHVELKAGNFKDPFMLQEQTSSKYVTFTERSLADAFSSGRHIGVMASTKHQHWTAAAGFFGDSVTTASTGKDEGWSVSGRLTYAPINQKTQLVHLGFAGDYRNTGDNNTVRFRQQPETHVSGVNIVDTGTISDVENFLKLGFELAAIAGPFSAQSEYIYTMIERNSGSDLDFDGWYVEAAYFLTGESRNYKKGKFGAVSPNTIVGRGGIGAWQLAARYSMLDLTDAEINGGEAESVTVGVNWFPTSTLRFSGNYVRILDVDGGPHHAEEPSLLQVRGQWTF